MKPAEIIKQATDNLPDGLRENYVFGNIFLYDVISTHITDLKSKMRQSGILHHSNKQQAGNLEKAINAGFSRIREQMGKEAYDHSPVILERFEDEFSGKLKVLFYTIKREYDRIKQPLSEILAHLSMIYLLSKFEIERTKWYAGKVQECAGIEMKAVYDQCIVSIRNISGLMIQKIQSQNQIPMKAEEIKMAFAAFEKELNECKVEFYKKTA